MRCLLVSLTLGLGAMGIVATTPGIAKATWPVSVAGSRTNGYGAVNIFGIPAVRIQSNGFGVSETIYSPGGYRTVFTPNGITRLWYGASVTNVSFNPLTGTSVHSTSPSVTGFIFSPYGGFRSVNIPGVNSFSGVNAFGVPSTFSSFNGLTTMGMWRGMNMPMFNLPIPGTGTFLTLPVTTLGAMATASAVMNNNSCQNMGSNAAAYQNYVPANFLTGN